MTVPTNPADGPWDGRPVAVAIGFFDGVHLGHRQVLSHTVEDARRQHGLAVAVTFDKHPNTIVAPQHVPALIQSLPQRIRAIAALGIQATWIVPFDLGFSRKTAAAFIHELTGSIHPVQSLSVGSSFTFGFKRGGTVATLQNLGAESGFAVHGLASVALDGTTVSSTRIRELVRAGDLDAASQMLGRPYALAGCVIPGRRIGRTLGFPTANLDTAGLVLPPNGVYAALASVDNTTQRAAVNIGSRPTIESSEQHATVEAHLLDFQGDLYGKELELTLTAYLRNECAFASSQTLKEQIARDVAQARAAL